MRAGTSLPGIGANVLAVSMAAAMLLFAGTALSAQQLHPVRPPGPALPAPAPGAAPPPQPASQPAPKPVPAPPASPQTNANTLPGQQFTPSKTPWVQHNYNPARARHDLKVAHFYFLRHNYAAALSRAQGALRHNPHWPPALFGAGLAAAKLQRWASARAYWAEYLQRAPHGKKAKAIRQALRHFPAPKPAPRH